MRGPCAQGKEEQRKDAKHCEIDREAKVRLADERAPQDIDAVRQWVQMRQRFRASGKLANG